ncbi:MAG: histidine kinase dimerization/phospho-acceptor domain-containing protein [Acetobacteraceae bacterium]
MAGSTASTRCCFPPASAPCAPISAPLPDEEPDVRRVLLTQIDLTESRRVETVLRQAMRLEAIGQLTGGVAHDFNNLLTAILGSLELLSRKLTDERQKRWVQTATSAAQRGATLTQQLLSYARKQFLAPKATDIPATIDAMGELVRGSLGGLIAVSTDFAAGTLECAGRCGATGTGAAEPGGERARRDAAGAAGWRSAPGTSRPGTATCRRSWSPATTCCYRSPTPAPA